MPLAGEKRYCSQCGQSMDWRLGRWECSACGNTDDPSAAETTRRQQEEQSRLAEMKGNVRGIQRKPVYRDGQVVGYESDAELTTSYVAPPATLLNASSTLYGFSEDPQSQRRRSDGLETEKKVYFAIQASLSGLSLLFNLGTAAIPGGPGFGYGIGTLLGTGLGLYLLWFALFGDQEWAKWCCGGLQALGIVASFIGIGAVLSVDQAEFAAVDFQMRGMLSTILWGASILQAIFGLWLIGILYRDIQTMRGKM